MIRHFRFPLPFLLAALSLLPSPGRAQTQAIDFVPGHTRFDFAGGTITSYVVGYAFSTLASATVSVYNLGFYDSGIAPTNNPGSGTATGPNGFTNSHEVGLYNATTGALLIQAVVPQNSALLASNFRYADQLLNASGSPINGPYTLTPGGAYFVVGVSHGENFTYVQNASSDLTHDPSVLYSHSAILASNTLQLPSPTDRDNSAGLFGGNFTTSPFPVANTPEPGPAAFAVCAAFAGLLWRAKRLRRACPVNSAS